MRTKETEALYIPAPRLNELNILREVSSDSEISQAELAEKCGLSVAMINNYMKDLCSRGLLEYRRKSAKCISYHLTGPGQEAVSSAQRDLLRTLVKLYGDAKVSIQSIVRNYVAGNPRRVILFGRGDLAELVYHALQVEGIDVVGMSATDSGMTDTENYDPENLTLSQLQLIAPDAIVVVDSASAERMEINLDRLTERGIPLIDLEECSADQSADAKIHPIAETRLTQKISGRN